MKVFKKSLNENNPPVNLDRISFIKKADNKNYENQKKGLYYIEFYTFDLDTQLCWIYEKEEERDKDYESMVY